MAGYSLGGAVAQEVWHRHPSRVGGLVLASTARNLRGHVGERMFFPVMTLAMHPLSRVALTKVERVAAALPELPSVEVADGVDWGRAEFRSTSAWSMPEVLGELGRFNSAPWIGSVDVPAAVVVTGRDKAIPTRRQRKLAAAIPDASVYDAPGGHASIVLDHERWAPVFLEAVADVTGRVPARADGGLRALEVGQRVPRLVGLGVAVEVGVLAADDLAALLGRERLERLPEVGRLAAHLGRLGDAGSRCARSGRRRRARC